MKKRYTEEQIVKILKEVESSGKLTEACRRYGVSDATIYNWRKKYGGLEVSELRKLKTLEEENRRRSSDFFLRFVMRLIMSGEKRSLICS
jgi:putative transposase